MGGRTAFFYGTLMAPEVLHRVCYGPGAIGKDPAKTYLASQLSFQPAILHDYCRHRVRQCDYPGIVAEDGHNVRGTYVAGLTYGDIHRLDVFEGDEYRRIEVKVELPKEAGKFVQAETYLYTAGERRLDKKEWSYEEFRRDKMHRWADNSNEYQEVDAAIEGDPTGGRGVKADTSVNTDKSPKEEAEEEEWDILNGAV